MSQKEFTFIDLFAGASELSEGFVRAVFFLHLLILKRKKHGHDTNIE